MTTGKMGSFEKSFVNSDRHSERVSLYAEKLVCLANPRPGQQYLDVGCGNGAAPIHIARTFELDITGVDVDQEQITIAQTASKGMANAHFMTLDSRDLPFADEKFDIVFTNKVIHHISSWRKAVIEMLRVLKPGGHLVYADFILPRSAARLGEALLGSRAGFPSRAELESLFAQNGLYPVYRQINLLHFEGVFLKGQE